jgi:hypothetical protein
MAVDRVVSVVVVVDLGFFGFLARAPRVVVSADTAFTVHTNDWLCERLPSLTVAVTLKLPAVVGVPLIRPVLAAIASPGGRLDAANVSG